jgi:hypothetical protein
MKKSWRPLPAQCLQCHELIPASGYNKEMSMMFPEHTEHKLCYGKNILNKRRVIGLCGTRYPGSHAVLG